MDFVSILPAPGRHITLWNTPGTRPMERNDDDDAIEVERLVLGDLLNHVLD